MVCKKCDHLMEPNHECPTQEYLEARNALVSAAAIAEETFGIEVLDYSGD